VQDPKERMIQHCELGSKGAGRKLSKRKPLNIVLIGYPLSLLNQVFLHMTG